MCIVKYSEALGLCLKHGWILLTVIPFNKVVSPGGSEPAPRADTATGNKKKILENGRVQYVPNCFQDGRRN